MGVSGSTPFGCRLFGFLSSIEFLGVENTLNLASGPDDFENHFLLPFSPRTGGDPASAAGARAGERLRRCGEGAAKPRNPRHVDGIEGGRRRV